MTINYLEFQKNALNETVGDMNEHDGFDCPICKNKGLTFHIKDGTVISRLCKCRSQRRAIRTMREMSINGDRKTLDSYVTKSDWQIKIKEGAYRYLGQNTSSWFFIGGQSGCGKTHICTAISYKLIERAQSLVYMQWVSRVRDIKEAIKNDYYREEIQKYKSCDVLYIDDLFKGREVSDADIKIAFDILNSRYLDKTKVTILSSELTLQELYDVDEACASRITERARGYIFNIAKSKEKNFRAVQLRE